MRPFSRVVPKELVPLGAMPALHRVLIEAREAGIDQVALVVRPEKQLLMRYVERMQEAGELEGITIRWVEQPEPRGLGDAMARCRDFAAGEPFALLLPDNLPLAPDYRLADLLTVHAQRGLDVVGVLAVDASRSGQYGDSGRFSGERIGPGLFRIERLGEKGPGRLEVAAGEVVHRTCGRYVCRPAILDLLDDQLRTAVGELDELPAYRLVAAAGGLLGRVVPQPLFDVGHPSGVLAASAWLHARQAASG